MMSPMDGERYDAMARDLADARAEIERLREAVRVRGGCRMLSEGESCDCGLCTRDGEIERLQAIVDRLPTTADGVPVTPGMELWHCTRHAWKPKGATENAPMTRGIRVWLQVPYCMGDRCYSEGCQSDDRGGEHVPFERCYSTREAAEVAESARVEVME